MRTVIIEKKIGCFSELPIELQEKAIADYRNIDVFLFEPEYLIDEFCNDMERLGVDVSAKDVRFSGFYCQGDGSSFSGKIDDLKLFIQDDIDTFSKYFSSEKEFHSFKRWCLHVAEKCDYNIHIRETRNCNDVYADVNIYSELYYIDYVKKSCKIKEKKFYTLLESLIEDKAKRLNNELFKALEQEYEYSYSDGYIKDIIEANGYEFNFETGELFS